MVLADHYYLDEDQNLCTEVKAWQRSNCNQQDIEVTTYLFNMACLCPLKKGSTVLTFLYLLTLPIFTCVTRFNTHLTTPSRCGHELSVLLRPNRITQWHRWYRARTEAFLCSSNKSSIPSFSSYFGSCRTNSLSTLSQY